MFVAPLFVNERACEQNRSTGELDCAFGALGSTLGAISGGIVYGGMIGAGSAMAIDSLVLGRDRVAVQSAPLRRASWTPTIKRIAGGATIGVAREFS